MFLLPQDAIVLLALLASHRQTDVKNPFSALLRDINYTHCPADLWDGAMAQRETRMPDSGLDTFGKGSHSPLASSDSRGTTGLGSDVLEAHDTAVNEFRDLLQAQFGRRGRQGSQARAGGGSESAAVRRHIQLPTLSVPLLPIPVILTTSLDATCQTTLRQLMRLHQADSSAPNGTYSRRAPIHIRCSVQ